MSTSTLPITVGFTGSRSLPSFASQGGLVWQVVASVLSSGRSISTGCAIGADSAVISAALHQQAAGHLTVHAAFGPAQPEHSSLPPYMGAWRYSGIPAVRAAVQAGAFVHWRAGAPSADHTWGATHSLPARLARRSQHLVAALTWGRGRGAGLVGFVAAPPPRPVRAARSWVPCGSGTWSTIALAAGHGIPVVVFPVRLSPSTLPAFSGGCWQPAASAGVWARGWRWVPSQLSLAI